MAEFVSCNLLRRYSTSVISLQFISSSSFKILLSYIVESERGGRREVGPGGWGGEGEERVGRKRR